MAPLDNVTISTVLTIYKAKYNSILEIVLIRVLHQHRVARLVLVVNKANVVLDVQHSAVRFILNGHEVQEQIVLDSTGSVRRQVRIIPGI